MKKRVFNLIIVDESGSMCAIRQQAFSGMNETLQTIKICAEQNPDLEQYVTLITFDSNHTNFHYNNAEGTTVVPLKESDYRPGGCTPLYDAIGSGIAKVNAQTQDGDSVLVTIITDGYENASREYDLKMVKNLVEKLTEQHWTFTFIGTDDLDVEGMASSMGIRHTLSFARNEEQADAMFKEERECRMCFYNEMIEPTASADVTYFKKKHV